MNTNSANEPTRTDAMASKAFKIALVQMLVGKDKAANVAKAVERVAEASKAGAKLVVLPECFNSPYGTEHFAVYSECIPGESTTALSQAAKNNKIWLIGGSIPEKTADGKLYNTSVAFNPQGETVAKHRKVHLFDIDVPGKIKFTESDVLTAGDKLTTFSTDFCKIGLGICYDVRFCEMARVYALQGCNLLVYPGCFNMTTGPAHWELMARASALEQQCFTALCSQARDTQSGGYVAWGHSMIVEPWGTVIADAGEDDTILYADIDLNKQDEMRNMVPVLKQRRSDLYDTIAK